MFVEEKKTGEAQVEQPSLAGFIAFLKKQPADRRYRWVNYNKCACGQYALAIGQFSSWSKHMNGKPAHIWTELNTIANPQGVRYYDTFGAALKRARKAQR